MKYLIRFGELFLKSEPVKNRMKNKLMKNIQAGLPSAEVTGRRGRVFAETSSTSPEKATDILGKVFGITSHSPVKEATTQQDLKGIKEKALEFVEKNKSFAVRTNRPYKKFNLNSQEINVRVGAYIQENTGNQVDLDNPEQEVFIEVFKDKSFIFQEKIPGPGGLPLGTSKRLLLRNENKNDQRAGWMMMKRGCPLDVLGEKAPVLEEWSLGELINYVQGDFTGGVDELMEEYPALVLGTKDPSRVISKPYPVFYPLIALPKEIGEKLEEIE